ncbi:MAG: UDP-glucose 4-epimerase GalE [Bacteroidales bacterium]
MKKILVTGGTGYIGSHTAVELITAGYKTVLLDNLSNSYVWVADRISEICGTKVPFYDVDLCDKEEMAAFFRQEGDFDAVIHFAALKAVGESLDMPLIYYRNNLVALMNLMEAMETNGVGNLVFSSSCTVYGEADQLPVSESAPVKEALSPYGNTKQIAEEIIRDEVNASESLHCISLRYFNPVGAHHSALIGELPMGVPNNLMPFITQAAIGKREVLRVFGNDYPTPDGTPIRDYIHVTDLARAHVRAVERILNKDQQKPWEVFNLGTGKGHSVLEVISAFEEATGIKVPWQFAPRRPGDIAAIWADTSLANRELDWRAEYGLHEMANSAWKWENKL